MNIRQASTSLTCVAAALLLQACVEYYPPSAFNQPPQPPQPPPNSPQYAEAPGVEAAPSPAPAPTGDDALVAPIALYPDPLIALILPASTVPSDISAASSYLIQYGDPTRVDSQPWDPSVRALAHYPTVITWMAQNIAWTQALGSAFLSSPTDVMDAVQRLRARALATGALVSTPQQQIYSEEGQIEIYPAQADSVYVPVYDDSVVFSEGPYDGYGGPFINFGEACPAGPWLSFYFDWGRHRVWAGDQNVWRAHSGWQPPRSGGSGSPPGAHAWRPPAGGQRNFQPVGSPRANSTPKPRPMQGAPIVPHADRIRNPSVPPAQPSHPAEPGKAAPPGEQARSTGSGSTPSTPERRQPVVTQSRSAAPPPPGRTSLPPPPPRAYSPQARTGEPSAPRSTPEHSSPPSPPSAPATTPATNSNTQQPAK
jgi:hypothetical protein